jgi:hypothetical protein
VNKTGRKPKTKKGVENNIGVAGKNTQGIPPWALFIFAIVLWGRLVADRIAQTSKWSRDFPGTRFF